MKYSTFFIFFTLSALTAGNKLDLSWEGLTKESFFRDMNGTVSDMVERATELVLRGNFFDRFVDCAAKLDKLEILDLSQNKLTRFYFACNEENNLYSLNVSHNLLPFLNDSALTPRVSRLQMLDLSFNVIQFLGKTTLQHLKNLMFLSLSGNPIKTNIEPGTFQNLSSLVNLDLSNISASEFPADLFTPLSRLSHVSLASNPITEVPALPPSLRWLDVSGTNIIRFAGMDYPQLHGLIINNMPILKFLDLNDFKKLPSLTGLSVKHCLGLEKISADETSGVILPRIKDMTIEHCSIDKLDENVVSILKRLRLLDLQDNPWQCDCSLQWVFSLNSTDRFHDHMRCASPATLTDKRVFDIPREEFNCNKINYVALSLSLAVVCIAGILIIVSYFAKETIVKRWRMSCHRGDTVSYKYITRNSNDGEKILDQCDMTDYP